MTNNDEMALKLKSAAEKATKGDWRRASTRFNGITATPFSLGGEEKMLASASEKGDAEFITTASPTNIIAMLAERDADKKRIGDMQAIVDAAEKLVRCKGRYHSEQNYRALAALFGVTTPDLPPLELEARTVNVKLPNGNVVGFRCRRKDALGEWSYCFHREPDNFEYQWMDIEKIYVSTEGVLTVNFTDCDYGAVQHMSGGSNDYCNGFVDGTQNAVKQFRVGLDAAGIKLEVEE